MGHRSFFLASLLAQAALAAAAALTEGLVWSVAALPAWGLLVLAYRQLRQTPYAVVLRPALSGVPALIVATALLPYGWAGVVGRWVAFFLVAGWHHSALQALREWERFHDVIGPFTPSGRAASRD